MQGYKIVWVPTILASDTSSIVPCTEIEDDFNFTLTVILNHMNAKQHAHQS